VLQTLARKLDVTLEALMLKIETARELDQARVERSMDQRRAKMLCRSVRVHRRG
jgi:hypothetical protein